MTNPLLELKALRQSAWLDDIDRSHLLSGQFESLVDEDGLSGTTGNPTIFEHLMTHDNTYDEQMQQLIAEGKSPQEIYEALAMTDVRMVADLVPLLNTWGNDFTAFFLGGSVLRPGTKEATENLVATERTHASSD